MLVATAFMLLAATGPVNPATGTAEWETVDRHCRYETRSDSTAYRGPCKEYNNYKTGEHTISFKGRKFLIKEYEPMRHELPWMFVRINAQPSVAYQHHRSWTSYTTMDFRIMLDVCHQAAGSGDCQ